MVIASADYRQVFTMAATAFFVTANGQLTVHPGVPPSTVVDMSLMCRSFVIPGPVSERESYFALDNFDEIKCHSRSLFPLTYYDDVLSGISATF